MAAGRSAVISCSKTAPETSSTTRTQTELPFGGAAMNRVSTPPVAMAKDATMSVSVGTHAGEREVKKALRQTLFKYRFHQDAELFEKAFSYIKEYY